MATEIFTMDWECGAHISFSSNIRDTIFDSIIKGMYTTQFFMGNPKTYNRKIIYKQDIEETKQLLKRFPMNVFSHFPYISNLAGSVKSLAWSGDDYVDHKINLLLKGLTYELEVLSHFNNEKKSGVVIHPGSYPDRKKGLDTIILSLNKINFIHKSKLLLENCAGEGNKLCRDFKEIKYIMDGLQQEKKEHIGVCVDTAHIWGQGDYDLSSCEEIERLFDDFEQQIGLQYFTLLHLNDSKVQLGAKKDRHESIGKGYIWSNSFDSLILLLNKCKYYNIPILLETTCDDMLTLEKIQPRI